MSRLQQIKDEIAQYRGYKNWADMYTSLVNRGFITVMVGRLEHAQNTYTAEMIKHNLERAAKQAKIRFRHPMSLNYDVTDEYKVYEHGHGAGFHFTVRADKESIINTEIELI